MDLIGNIIYLENESNSYIPEPESTDVHSSTRHSRSHNYHYFSLNNYLWIFIIAILFFTYACFYYYTLVRKYVQKINFNPEEETKVEQAKNDMFKNLTIYSLIRSITLIIIFILGNPIFNDMTSFFMVIFKVFPFLILMSILLNHVSFLIEKFYQIKYKKNDIFFNPSLEVLNIMIYIIFSLFTFACLLKEKYQTYTTLSQGIIAFVSAILSVLYFYYGIGLSSIYSSKKNQTTELKEKKFLHNRLLSLAIAIGALLGIKSVLSYLICLNVFEFHYPSCFNKNIWEFMNFMIFELGILIILGITKQTKEKKDSLIGNESNLFNNEIYNNDYNNYNYNNQVQGKVNLRSNVIKNNIVMKEQKELKINNNTNDYFNNNENDLTEPFISRH